MYINCKEKAEAIKNELKEKISLLEDKPVLTVLQVGDNPASNTYVNGKKKDCEYVGIKCNHVRCAEDTTEEELIANVQTLQKSSDGIIVQLPLPKHINEKKVIDAIDPKKDVDGFRVDSVFTPCTPLGIMTILESITDLAGKDVLIINRSNIVGRPLVNLLLDKDATVTIAHSKTQHLERMMLWSDVIITAVGHQNFVRGHMIKQDAIIIDVAMNRDKDGKLCGDVSEYCSKVAYVTPTPGGTGIMTRCSLLMNTYKAYELFRNKEGDV